MMKRLLISGLLLFTTVTMLCAESDHIIRIRKKAERFKHLKYPFLAPSTHWGYQPPEKNVDYAALYSEMRVEKSYHGTYFMSCGFNCGYFGIQEIKDRKLVIYSLWDSGGGKNKSSEVDKEKRVQVLYSNPKGKTTRFGGEGSGAKTMMNYPWKLKSTYRFLVSHQLQEDGTIYTGWFYSPEEKKWIKIASYKTPTKFKNIRGFYSFHEDFIRNGDTGQHLREVYYPNPQMMKPNGTWLPVTHARNTIAGDVFQNAHGDVKNNEFYLLAGANTRNYDKENSRKSISGNRPQPDNLPKEFVQEFMNKNDN